MVMGYQCPEHGLHQECDVDESGERICPEGADTAVTGITGSTRQGPPGSRGSISGDIVWNVSLGYGTDTGQVRAFDFEDAFETALEKYSDEDDEAHITSLEPRKRELRR